MLRLGFNGATTMKASLEEDIRNAADAGFDGVELWGAKLDKYLGSHSASDLKALLAKARIPPLSINSIEDATYSPDRKSVIDRCRTWSKLCAEMGCPVIVVVPGVAPKGTSSGAIVEQSARELRELADIAAPHGVRLAFEMIGGQGRSVSEIATARRVILTAERKNLGLIVDTFHAYVGGSLVSDLRTLEHGLLDIIHINDAEPKPKEQLTDANRLFPGDGALPLKDILGAFTGYQGVASVEIFRPEYWGRDPASVARTAHDKARAVLKSAGLLARE
jgi:2-keto-myo-inositol isomerase